MTTPTISISSWRAEPAAAPLRLTPRGQALLLALFAATLVCIAVGALLGGAANSSAGSTHAAAIKTAAIGASGAELSARGLASSYTVEQGDTLWDLASAIAPTADPRPTVDLIQQINGMSTADLVVGRQLWLPVEAAPLG